MEIQQSKKHLIDPYRTLGNFVSGKITLSQSTPHALIAPTNSSFKVYSHSLNIKVASPPLSSPIIAALSYNQFSYLRIKDHLIKMKYHHIIRKWDISGGEEKSTILKFDSLIVLAEKSFIALIDEQTNQIIIRHNNMKLQGMVHPVTYVNKLIIYSKKSIALVNLISDKILYEYPKLSQFIAENDLTIAQVEATPLVDIISLGFDNGIIAFLNLKKDQIVFTVRQKLTPTALAFSTENSFMASGDSQGNVILWDLENKRILYKLEKCIDGAIDSLIFIPGFPILTCASSASNCIRQVRVNLQDSKILSLYRERVGNQLPLQKIIIANNNQLVLSTATESMFISFYSQCNNYLLPRTLDSKLPYHLLARHFNVELYKERSLQKTFKLHQYALQGKISLSNKYYIVATARRLVKLGASYEVEWKVPNIKHIHLYNEHYIYAITPNQIVVCDFNTDTIVSRIPKNQLACSVTNLYNNLLAFWNPEENTIQVWDMDKISQGRVFALEERSEVLCLSFTSDNKFLISSHNGGLIVIWSIVDNQLYKQFQMENGNSLIWHCFTPDNQFMISIFEGKKQANVWNNYIGKISSSRAKENISFNPQIRILDEDYRKQFNKGFKQQQLIFDQSADDILDNIPDVEDGVPEYNFKDIAKWMPLVFYDEIKARNTPDMKGNAPSMPFFLDFRNLTQQKKKIQAQIKKEAIQKKKAYNQQKDKHLQDKSNQIKLDQNSSQQNFLQAFVKLTQLSIAQVDYQLRRYLLTPVNKSNLIKMMIIAYKSNSISIRQQLKNIILHRIISIIGSEIVESDLGSLCEELFEIIEKPIQQLKAKVDRCIIIADKYTA